MFMSIFNLRGAQTDRFRYEVFQNLFFSPMNTGFPRDTVATVPTVYGIETIQSLDKSSETSLLQQYLPFTVLKPRHIHGRTTNDCDSCNSTYRLRY